MLSTFCALFGYSPVTYNQVALMLHFLEKGIKKNLRNGSMDCVAPLYATLSCINLWESESSMQWGHLLYVTSSFLWGGDCSQGSFFFSVLAAL